MHDPTSYAEPVQQLADLEWLGYKARNNSVVDDLFTGQLLESLRCTVCNKLSIAIQPFNVLPVPLVEPRDVNGLVYLEDCFDKFARVENLEGPNGLRCECANKASSAAAVAARGAAGQFNGDALNASPVLQGNGNAGGGGSGATGPLLQSMHRRRMTRFSHVHKMDQSPVGGGGGGNIHAPTFSPIAGGGGAAVGLTSPPSVTLRDSDMPPQHDEFRTSTPIHGMMTSSASSSSSWKLTDGQRRSLLRQLPECLVVQLLRFNVDATSRGGAAESTPTSSKSTRPLRIPLTQLDLTPFVIDNVMQREDIASPSAAGGAGGGGGCYSYELCGVCVHVGAQSTAHGHYVAFVKTRHCGWCRFDDEQVTRVNMQYEVTTRQVRENAYLLFYRRSSVS